MKSVDNHIFPIFWFGNEVLLISKSDLPMVGKQLGVLAVKIDIKECKISPKLIDLERYLKFGYWYEIVKEEERERFIRIIKERFSALDINNSVVNPLISMNRKETIGQRLFRKNN
jgi:hypothetical protein